MSWSTWGDVFTGWTYQDVFSRRALKNWNSLDFCSIRIPDKSPFANVIFSFIRKWEFWLCEWRCWRTTEGAIVIGVVNEAGDPWNWLIRRLPFLFPDEAAIDEGVVIDWVPDNDRILLRKPETALVISGSSWAGRAISKWSAKLKLAICEAGSV